MSNVRPHLKRRHLTVGEILDYSLRPPSRATVRRAYANWRQEQGMPYWCDNQVCRLRGTEPRWNGQSLMLTLDHVDGNSSNNRPSNLRLLCPNCDAQLPTRGGRNKGRVRNKTLDSYHLVERDGTHEVKVMLRGVQATAQAGSASVRGRSEA